MSARVAIFDLDGSERIHDLAWMSLVYTFVLNAAGGAEIDVSMTKVARADVEPGQSDYRIYEDEVLVAEGRIMNARVDTDQDTLKANLVGEGIAGILGRRLADWNARYEPVLEDPADPAVTMYEATQQDILWDSIYRSQLEDGGDLGITRGSHIGGDVLRRRQYCASQGIALVEVFDDFPSLANGLEWAFTPTLIHSTFRNLRTWNPSRGEDLTGSVVLDGTIFLDDLTYEIDAGQIVSRGRSTADPECPLDGDYTDAEALDDYGLLEAFADAESDTQEDADDTAEGLISKRTMVGTDVTYRLSEGPALGTFDLGDLITLQSSRPGWELDIPVKVQEIGVTHDFPNQEIDDDEHTFVRVNVSEFADVAS